MTINLPTYYINGKILANPSKGLVVESIAVADGLVVGINELPPEGNKIVDLGGQFVLPGFIDSHLHLTLGSEVEDQIQLSECKTRHEFISILNYAIDCHNGDGWIIATGWSRDLLKKMPDQSWIPTTDIPIICYSMDLHTAICNKSALNNVDLKVLCNTPGGVLAQDGVVQEDALFNVLNEVVPQCSEEQCRVQVRRTIKRLNAAGITMVGTMEECSSFSVLQAIAQETHAIRIRAMCLDSFASFKECPPLIEDDFFRLTGFKSFADGSLGSRTAKLYDNYENSSHSGVATEMSSNLRQWAAEVASYCYAPVIHAIGDQAVGMSLDALQAMDLSLVPRIEHAQLIHEKDISRIRDMWFGVQPLHQPQDQEIAVALLGDERAALLHDWRRMLDHGARLSFGSDWPVVPFDPMTTMKIAIQNGLSKAEAIIASTQDAALSLRSPKAGNLLVGSFADFIVLDSNPMEDAWAQSTPNVRQTYVSGRAVYGE